MFENFFRGKSDDLDMEEGLPDEVPETPRGNEITDAINDAADLDATFEDDDEVEVANIDEEPEELNFDDDKPMAA